MVMWCFCCIFALEIKTQTHMDKYTNYCTAEQTITAYRFGAPMKVELADRPYDPSDPECDTPYVVIGKNAEDNKLYDCVRIPTTQQMLGWLRECVNLVATPIFNEAEEWQSFGWGLYGIEDYGNEYEAKEESTGGYDTHNVQELKAIDAAMRYLDAKYVPLRTVSI